MFVCLTCNQCKRLPPVHAENGHITNAYTALSRSIKIWHMSNFPLRALSVFVNIFWWLCCIFCAFIFSVLFINLYAKSYFQRDIPVYIKSVSNIPVLQPAS